MLRAIEVVARGDWHGTPADSVVLDFDDRHRRRLALAGVGGLSFLLDLPEAVALRGGDAVKLEDGRLIEIVGEPEKLVEIRAKDAEQMLRLAWHLGNRHLPLQVASGRLRIRRDHVVEAMLAGLGATLRPIEAPFDPEGGAYAEAKHGHAAGHDHAHLHHKHDHHGHDHHGHDHATHQHGHNHDHACGPGCGHDHSHDHAHHEHKHDVGHDHAHGHKHD